MSTLSSWAIGAVVALLGVLGLVLASRAMDGAVALFGLALFGFAVLFDFGLIRRAYDERERAAAEAATAKQRQAA
jgi:hypothetical protein